MNYIIGKLKDRRAEKIYTYFYRELLLLNCDLRIIVKEIDSFSVFVFFSEIITIEEL